ncbi:MAG: bifunctional diaminohydroxyphosphoribosylaminopyrimidine deaminase/5-amino-6-(5-phosphoribosylamino)uracil reductase RibD [Acidobacteriia bacterium]|nr:bifunctional diaminohydroxyphosphoribosylaminopyrimidine deaminase/5-amino-6-(5-phosphoribosylamino)uracil reductase RibD [Terriglobia bacterium]
MNTSADDLTFMKKALELARRGIGQVSPGALVGAVVVKHGDIVGEGFYQYDRRKHAEVIAVEKAGRKAAGATLYLNLEPCSHFGRTPPCADFLIQNKIRRVVCAMKDPNPLVSGKGFQKLRKAGIPVETGLLGDEAARLNEQFVKHVATGKPFVTLKTAMTLDGKIAFPNQKRGSITWITGESARRRVHDIRHAHDAILVGINTVLKDDPQLTDRSGRPRRRRLLRVILDAQLRLPLRSQIVRSAHEDVLAFCQTSAKKSAGPALAKHGVEVVPCLKTGLSTSANWNNILKELGKRQIQSLLIEGGAATNSSALRAGVVDKFHFFIAPKILNGRDAVPVFAEDLGRSSRVPASVDLWSIEFVGEDLLVTAYAVN